MMSFESARCAVRAFAVVGAVALSFTASGPAKAASVPHFDIGSYCKSLDRQRAGDTDIGDKSCAHKERVAKKDLGRGWARVPERAVNFCMDVATSGGPGSYVLLKDCIHQETAGSGASDTTGQ